MVSDKATRPAGTANLQTEDWKGTATGGKIRSALGYIGDVKFSKDPQPEKEEAPETPEKKTSSIMDYLRSMAHRALENENPDQSE